jgi:hypothetical protein
MTEKAITMEKTRDRKKTIIEAFILLSILAIAFAGLWFLAEYIRESDEVEPINSPINVSLRINNGNWIVEFLNAQTLNNSVYKLLLECSHKHNFSVGYTYWPGYDSVFINSINGTENGDNDMWWQYYVNDVYGEIGCDKKEIFNGDLVEWRFEDPRQ